MEELGPIEYGPVTILDVLGVDLCARAILDRVPVAELVRSERVSRRWQRAVLHYLQTGPTLSYEGFINYSKRCDDIHDCEEAYHRAIILNEGSSLTRKTLNKWGPYIVKVTDLGKDLDIIVSECPNLEQIEVDNSFNHFPMGPLVPITLIKKLKQLKQIVMIGFKHSDLVLGELFQDTNCENITICYNDELTGSFLKSLTSDSLKSLSLTTCLLLSVSELFSIDKLRNLTSLELDEGQNESLNDVHLLLSEMPQLEELIVSFKFYYSFPSLLGEEWIQAFTRLGNLKRLTMRVTGNKVNDTLLEGLARGCKKLEYLEIRGSLESITVRGLRALCCRSPSARTKLHFSPLDNARHPWDNDEYYFATYFEPAPLYRELAALGCVELTLEWFRAARHDPRGRDLPLNTSRGSRDPQKELKLLIF